MPYINVCVCVKFLTNVLLIKHFLSIYFNLNSLINFLLKNDFVLLSLVMTIENYDYQHFNLL